MTKRFVWPIVLVLLLIGGAFYFVSGDRDATRDIRFGVYRPSTAQYFLDAGAARGGRIDVDHEVKDTVSFGVPGDIGLLCPQNDPADPHGYRVFAGGNWYFTARAIRPVAGDLVLGQAGDLPFCADFDGDGLADSGIFRDGAWLIKTRRAGAGADIRFSLGTSGDRPVALNVAGTGNATDRKNVVYGIYRQGTWYLDTKGTGAVDATHAFGGPQDLPFLIPRWSPEAGTEGRYSLAVFRDGTWYVKPDPDAAQILSFSFGQAGDLPGFVYRKPPPG